MRLIEQFLEPESSLSIVFMFASGCVHNGWLSQSHCVPSFEMVIRSLWYTDFEAAELGHSSRRLEDDLKSPKKPP